METNAYSQQQIDFDLDKKSLKVWIEEYQMKKKQTLEEVNWIIWDMEKNMEGWDVYFSLDSFHIHDYAFPSVDTIFKSLTTQRDAEIIPVIQNRFALQYLFFQLKFGKLIMLPPHLIELKNHLKNIDKANYCDCLQFDSYRESLFTAEEKTLISQAGEEYEEYANLSQSTKEEVVKLIFKKLSDVLFLLSDFSVTGLKAIKKLFENDRIRFHVDDMDDFKEVVAQSVNLNEDEIDIYVFINTYIRKGKVNPNKRDTNTVRIVSELNRSFKNQKKIIYLLSDVNPFMQLFHMEWYPRLYDRIDEEFRKKIQNMLTIFDSPNTMHRTTNIFLEYMSASTKEDEMVSDDVKTQITIDRLRQRRDKIAESQTFDKLLSKYYADCNDKKCDDCLQKEKCTGIKQEIVKWNNIFSDRLSLVLLENFNLRESSLLGFDNNKFEEAIKSIVAYLNKKDKKFENELAKKRQELEDALFDVYKDLFDLNDLSNDIHEELIYRIKPTRKIPFEIRFNNPNIVTVLQESETYIEHEEKDFEKARQISMDIFNLTGDEALGTERYLLLAIVNYNFNQLGNVCLVLSDRIKDETLDNYEDYLLVYLLALHQNAINKSNTKLYEKARLQCEASRCKYKENGKFENMYGELLARGIDSGLENEINIETVLDIFKNAYRLAEETNENDSFKAHILNNMAYTIYLKESHKKDFESMDSELLFEAKSHLEKMETLMPLCKWDAQFLDSKGSIFFLLSKLYAENYAEESRACFEKASEKAKNHKFLEYEIKTIEKHRKLCNAEHSSEAT